MVRRAAHSPSNTEIERMGGDALAPRLEKEKARSDFDRALLLVA
jgi:hypothetical protein